MYFTSGAMLASTGRNVGSEEIQPPDFEQSSLSVPLLARRMKHCDQTSLALQQAGSSSQIGVFIFQLVRYVVRLSLSQHEESTPHCPLKHTSICREPVGCDDGAGVTVPVEAKVNMRYEEYFMSIVSRDRFSCQEIFPL